MSSRTSSIVSSIASSMSSMASSMSSLASSIVSSMSNTVSSIVSSMSNTVSSRRSSTMSSIVLPLWDLKLVKLSEDEVFPSLERGSSTATSDYENILIQDLEFPQVSQKIE
jgi:hypothetical protein